MDAAKEKPCIAKGSRKRWRKGRQNRTQSIGVSATAHVSTRICTNMCFYTLSPILFESPRLQLCRPPVWSIEICHWRHWKLPEVTCVTWPLRTSHASDASSRINQSEMSEMIPADQGPSVPSLARSLHQTHLLDASLTAYWKWLDSSHCNSACPCLCVCVCVSAHACLRQAGIMVGRWLVQPGPHKPKAWSKPCKTVDLTNHWNTGRKCPCTQTILTLTSSWNASLRLDNQREVSPA